MDASGRIVVVGGGIVGASVAYHLARREVPVTVVEGGQAGTATDAGAGIICPWTESVHGAGYRLMAEGARYYPELLAMLADDGQDETGHAQVGTLCVAEDTDHLRATATRLREQRAAWPEIGEVELLGQGEPTRLFPPLATGLGGVWIGGGARVDGRSVRDSLLRAAAQRGARRIPGTATLDLTADRVTADRVTGVRVAGDFIGADAVVVAAGAWTAQVCAGLGESLPVGPQRGQIVHARLPGADTGSWPVVLPAGDPYLLGFPCGRVVMGATREDAGFDYVATVGGVGGLLASAVRLAPGLSQAELLETRIGFRPVTPDGLPLVGRVADGLIVAAGHGPQGLTAGPWTGRAAAALALGEPPATDLTPFSPARFNSAPGSVVE